MDESRRITNFLTLIVIILLMLLVRIYIGSATEFRRAEVSRYSDDDITAAIYHYGRSIKWYAPLNPWVKKSIVELWDIGDEKLRDGDRDTAILSIQILRSSLYSARGPFTPFKDWILKADIWLNENFPHELPDRENGMGLDDYPGHKEPNRAWSLLAAIGFLGWVFAVFAFIFTVMPSTDEKIVTRRAVGVSSLIALFYIIWILGLYLA